MPRTPAAETRARIVETALELFAAQGLGQTSLQQIADRLGITKAALYYHFASREELVLSLVQPLVERVDRMLDQAERERPPARELLSRYFDLVHSHRRVTMVLINNTVALGTGDFMDRAIGWQRRMTALLSGPDPTLAEQARAIVAVGGLSDCTIQFPDHPVDQVRVAALDAACAALGLPTA